MSEKVETENKEEEQPKKKKKKKKKKVESTEEKDEKEKEKEEEKEKDKEKEEEKEKKEKKEKKEEKEKKETAKNEDNDNIENIKELNKEALANIPSKEVPKKKKKKKKEEQNVEKENNDKKETKEIKEAKEAKEIDINEIINNNNDNNNNGELMITELSNVEGGKKKRKKKKKKTIKENENNENIQEIIKEEKEKEPEAEPEAEPEPAPDKKNIILKDKLNSLEISDILKNGINDGIAKSNEELYEDMKNDKISISKKVISNKELKALSKSLEYNNVFLTGVNKFFAKEKIKNFQFLKNQEIFIKKNIAKLNQNQKMIEGSIPLKSDIVEDNIRKNQLKQISKSRDDLVLRLGTINQTISNLLKEEKLKQKNNRRQNLSEIVEDNRDGDENFNLHLAQIQKDSKKIRKLFQIDLQKAINKRMEKLDREENNIKELKKKIFNEARQKEKEQFLKRKNEINKKLEKTKKFINEKLHKTEKDYLFFKYQENFEKKEKKLIDKINMTKKEHVITQEELKELKEKISQQKQFLQGNAEEKKKELQKIWNFRSQTLPSYQNPLLIKIEEERIKKMNDEEDEKKKKECNQLEKSNYRPPSVKISKILKKIREKKINANNREGVLETEKNNKKRTNFFKFTPIKSNKNRIIKDEKSLELNNNNYIDLNEIKESLVIKNKSKLKPIQILHPKPDKPINYLKLMKEKRNASTDMKCRNVLNFDDLLDGEKKNSNIAEALEIAKVRTKSNDLKVARKKDFMNVNGGHLQNPYLASEIGDLLVGSIQAKLKLMYQLRDE